jgi:hypothetical protein
LQSILIYLYTSRNSDSVYLGLDSDWLLVENITGYIPAAVLVSFPLSCINCIAHEASH